MRHVAERPAHDAPKAHVALGFVAALLAVLVLGEAFARLYLPPDIRRQLGQDPQGLAIYKADPVLGADYHSYPDFHAANAERLSQLGPLSAQVPTWLFLGNSFVQAPGMLADTARQALPGIRIFNLARNVDLPLRAAEARLLLGQGLEPRRIVFALLPNDTLQIGQRPLSFIDVNAAGAIATRVRWPGPPWDSVMQSSRLATIAWIRSGRGVGNPDFRGANVAERPLLPVLDDLRRILSTLAIAARDHNAPVTVLAIPNREQIFGRAGFGFQAALRELCLELHLDYYNAGEAFLEDTDKRSLFLPDWHFSARGNQLLLRGLLDYIEASGSRPPDFKAAR
jgi:hypothetical protein